MSALYENMEEVRILEKMQANTLNSIRVQLVRSAYDSLSREYGKGCPPIADGGEIIESSEKRAVVTGTLSYAQRSSPDACAGSPLPISVYEDDKKLGIDIWTGDGSSETLTVGTKSTFIPRIWMKMGTDHDKPIDHFLLNNSFLVAIPLVFVRAVDEEGKDVIRSGGEWIPSSRIEGFISTHPAVAEVAAIGVPDPKWGERPMALIVTKPEYKGRVTEDDIKKHLVKEHVEKSSMPSWWVPNRVIFVEEMPKTSTGKIDKKVLREEYKR